MKSEPKAPAMKLFVLRPKDEQAPPFHFAGVPLMLMVVAPDEAQARHMAAASNAQAMMPAAGDVPSRSAWEDPALSSCEEFTPTAPGVVASA